MGSGLRYAVIGTGALGGFYGARLQRAGAEVHYLLHSDYDHVKAHGLVVESPDGDFTLPDVYAYADAQKMPPCDVAIVALKTTQNHLLSSVLPPLTETGVVLVLQNGLGVEAQVAEWVGSDRVLGGLCFLCSNKVGPGHIRHMDYKKIAMGEYRADQSAGGVTKRMEAIAHDFEQADIPIECAADLVLARWKKLVWNIPFNGLSVILNATTDAMMGDDNARTLAIILMKEVQQGASSQGRTVPDDFLQIMLDHTVAMTPYRTSMKIDYDEKRPLEVEAMYGMPLRTAQAAGVALPHIETLYHQLKFLDRRNRRE